MGRSSERVNFAKNSIEQTPADGKSVKFLPYWLGREARECETNELDKILSQKVSEPVETKRTALFVFEPKKVGSLRFCANYE